MSSHAEQDDPPPTASTPGAADISVARAIAYLAEVQLPGGEFPSYERSAPTVEGPGRLDSSPFVTTFALYALSISGMPAARPLVERGCDFLLREREAPGVWRYWTAANPKRIDPDLDDTCCASFVLRWLGHAGFEGGNEAAILANRTPSGLFKTWLRPPALPNDLDSVVNANVLLYLGERPETAAACALVCHAIERGMEESTYHYYLDPLALYYMVSRAYVHGVRGFGGCRDAVVAKTLARQEPGGGFGSPLLTALALCTLCNFGAEDAAEVARGARALIGAQHADGSWEDALFYAGPEPPAPHRFWWSAPALVTSLCIEALSKAGTLTE